MRNSDRIRPILDDLEKIWMEYPDLRLGQLIGNVFQTASATSYYLEDEEYIDALKEYYGINRLDML